MSKVYPKYTIAEWISHIRKHSDKNLEFLFRNSKHEILPIKTCLEFGLDLGALSILLLCSLRYKESKEIFPDPSLTVNLIDMSDFQELDLTDVYDYFDMYLPQLMEKTFGEKKHFISDAEILENGSAAKITLSKDYLPYLNNNLDLL